MVKKFAVSGMTCSACALGIEKAVKAVNGVSACNVSLMGKSMTVDYNEKIISQTDIISAVEKIGYKAGEFGENSKDNTAEVLKKRFFVSLILLLPLLYLSMGKMFSLPVFEYTFNLPLQAVLSLIIIAINFKFYINGTKAVLNLSPNMDTLVALGSASAFIYSFIQMFVSFAQKQASPVFFESSAMVVSLVTLGKWLEELTKRKTGKEIEKLVKLMPKTVTVIRDNKEFNILTSELIEGDEIICRAGDYIPIDGIVKKGTATVDKSAITGESIPEEAWEGTKVTSGSVVKSGYLYVIAEKVGENTVFNKIIQAVENAGASKAPIQKFADKVARWFVPSVTFIAVAVFVIRIIITKDLYASFNFAISVLVISCPCALGLATPVAVMCATGKGASMGILFRDAESLQKTKNINCVALDKTATLTVGKPKVTEFRNLSELSDTELKQIAFSLEKNSNHPLSQAVMDFCSNEIELQVEGFEYQIGKGVCGTINGVYYRLGNYGVKESLLKEFSGESVITLSANEKTLCVFAISDYLKESSVFAVKKLNESGIKTVMITGDNQSSAKAIAEKTGISDFRANVLPEGKLNEIEKLKERNYFVAMVGDGINDSPALKKADIGIAMGNGTDIAIDSADIVLSGGNLLGVADAISLSKKAVRIIKGNLFWAFIYNVLMIPVAGGLLESVGVVLTPVIAAACMCFSSLFVVLNALRINLFKSQTHKKTIKQKGEQSMKIIVKGMMCKHCQAKVEQSVKEIDGVENVAVNLKKGIVEIQGNVSYENVKNVIENAGYTVCGIKE